MIERRRDPLGGMTGRTDVARVGGVGGGSGTTGGAGAAGMRGQTGMGGPGGAARVTALFRVIFLLLPALVTGGCGPAGPGGEPPAPSGEEPAPGEGGEATGEDESLLVPPGYGTLMQDEITLRIRGGDLLIQVTPLEEWIIRLTAPDTYERMKGLAETHGERAGRRALSDDPTLFLVSLFSYEPDVPYQPEDLLLVNRGLRFRPEGIAAVTPSWGTQRLAQQETRMAVYAFGGDVDLERDLVVEYEGMRNAAWRERIVPRLQAELAKVKARAGGGA
jgi:hypothetical protein